MSVSHRITSISVIYYNSQSVVSTKNNKFLYIRSSASNRIKSLNFLLLIK